MTARAERRPRTDKTRQQERERKRRQRERAEGVVCSGSGSSCHARELLREASFLEADADNAPVTLGRGLAKMVEAWAASVTRDIDGGTSGGRLSYLDGQWFLEIGD
jgi:hypothetical protein